jgi:hypothetical protein
VTYRQEKDAREGRRGGLLERGSALTVLAEIATRRMQALGLA